MNDPSPNHAGARTEKASAYHRLKRRLAVAEYCLGFLYLLALLATGWTFDLRDLAIKAGGGPAVWILLYFVIGALVYEILTLPLNIVSGYLLEKKFGLLNQSGLSWALDLIKAQLVGLALGAIAVEILYLFLRWAGGWWWLPAGAAFALLFIILAQLSPVIILPLFFKFKKLPDDDLTERLLALCRRAGTEVHGIYEWGLSSKTKAVNAALMGWGRTRRVVLADNLLRGFTPSEVEVVLAHELGHQRLHHLPKLLLVQVAVTFLAFLLANAGYRLVGPSFGLGVLSDAAGLPLLVLCFTVVGVLSLPAVNYLSRRFEQRADLFALQLTGLVGSFISTMERLVALNLGEMKPHPVVEFLFHAHPSPARRIQAAKEFRESMRRVDAVH